MKWLITGGAGFIGCNAAKRLLESNQSVVVLDNLSRPGSEKNLKWLKNYGSFDFVKEDIRNPKSFEAVFSKHSDIGVVLHLAAQVAVTTSVGNPREDFEINLLGTLNLCEAIRQYSPSAILLNASTNKVYGQGPPVIEKSGRYEYRDFSDGVGEELPLDFHSPYGCSKGASEQYVRDYSRIYDLRTVSFRQSCIYGTRQFGIEDQGWVAWFMIAASLGKAVTIYGDGKQVRDILWVDDLTDCFLAAVDQIDKTSGKIYNIGGGPANTISVLDLMEFIEKDSGRKISCHFAPWRPGDQKVYISNIQKAKQDFGWSPKISKSEGLSALWHWVNKERRLFEELPRQ